MDRLKFELLNELTLEVQSNIDRMHFLDTSFVSGMHYADSLAGLRLELFHEGIDSSDLEVICKGFWTKYNTFNLKSDVFKNLIKRNLIKEIEDKTLKLAITNYYRRLEREEHYNLINNTRMKKSSENTLYGLGTFAETIVVIPLPV
jgi:hypothetical protein